MSTIEYENIKKIMHNSKELLGAKYDMLFNSKLLGILDAYFIESELDQNLKTILNDFIMILESEEYNKYPNYKKFCLYTNNDFVKCYLDYSFPISMYINESEELTEENTVSCYQFPLFFKELCVRYDIEPYASMDINDIDHLLCNNLNIIHEPAGIRKGHKIPLKGVRVVNANYSEESVTEYNDYYDPEKRCNMQPRIIECVRAEEISLSLIDKGRKIWVSRCGPGYGYDILNIDGETENLIEVKTSSNEDGTFFISKNEKRMMHQIEKSPNTNYFIHVYQYNIESEHLESEMPEIYKYDKENHVLVNIKDNTIISPQALSINKSVRSKNFEVTFTATPSPKTLALRYSQFDNN